jgi:hypothetical protein
MNLKATFWQDYQITESDLETIYNHLLEIETPQTISELSSFLIKHKIDEENTRLEKARLAAGDLYLPQNQYQAGQKLVFPKREMEIGVVSSVRPGTNPDYPALQVIEVDFPDNTKVDFASNLADHKLNDLSQYENKDPNLDLENVAEKYGDTFSRMLNAVLEADEDLVCIAGSYFPRSLLVDINAGYLNLAEAVLEMEQGGPLSSHDLIHQVELPSDVNAGLTEFSFNLAMQEDGRFDEVGPAGVTLWFLRRLEPDEVQHIPRFLQYTGQPVEADLPELQNPSMQLNVADELGLAFPAEETDSVTLSLIYPHLRAGTLPLTSRLKKLFPTAYETPRIKFDFIDGKTKARFPGWVVRPDHFIYGLSEWYAQQGIIPGSLIKVSRGENAGEVVIEPENQHHSREYIRSLVVGADGGFVFATLKVAVTCTYDERMVVKIPDFSTLDPLWERYNKASYPLEKIALPMMRDLTRLNPQGHVHAEELYSAVNVVKRCPPEAVLRLLFTSPWSTHLGDLYFRLNESNVEE